MINYIQYFCIGFATLILITACSADKADAPKSDGNESYPMIEETYFTERDEGDNVNLPAIWHGSEGQHWLPPKKPMRFWPMMGYRRLIHQTLWAKRPWYGAV